MTHNKKHLGSDFEDFLEPVGDIDDADAVAALKM